MKENKFLIEDNKTIMLISLAFYAFVVLILYTLANNNVIDWIIRTEWDVPVLLDWSLRMLFFGIQWSLITAFVLSVTTKKMALYMIPFSLISFASMFFVNVNYLVFSAVFPNLLVLFWILKEREQKTKLLLLFVINLACIAHQGAYSAIQLNIDFASYNVLNFYAHAIYSITLIVMISILYYIRRLHNETTSRICPIYQCDRIGTYSEEENEAFDLTGFNKSEKVRFWIILIVGQLLQWILLLTVSYTIGVFWFSLISSTLFVLLGSLTSYKIHWRLENPWKEYIACTITTAGIFALVGHHLPPFHLMPIMAIVGALLIIVILNRLAPIQEIVGEWKKQFDINNCTMQQLKERVVHIYEYKKGHGAIPKEEYLSFSIDAYFNKVSDEELMKKYNYSDTTVVEYKNKRRREIVSAYEPK